MIWVTWRQHRIEALIAGILLAIVIFILITTGIEMISTYQSTGLASCNLQQPTCSALEGNFITQFGTSVVFIGIAISTLPLLAGMFIGAPLVAREMEQRTYRLVWTQSISRMRWFVTKLILLISITLLAFIVLAALSSWWSHPWIATHSLWVNYDINGILLPVYAIFALALGIAAGILVRRSVAAMGITIVLFVLLRLVVMLLLRPYFLPPLTYISTVEQKGPPSHTDWTIHVGTIDLSGHEISDIQIGQICPQLENNGSADAFTAFIKCEQDHGFKSFSLYQPVERYWPFQCIEAAIFLLLAIALLTPTAWFLSKKVT